MESCRFENDEEVTWYVWAAMKTAFPPQGVDPSTFAHAFSILNLVRTARNQGEDIQPYMSKITRHIETGVLPVSCVEEFFQMYGIELLDQPGDLYYYNPDASPNGWRE